MKIWERLLARGKRQLAQHNFREALDQFHRAVKECPVEQKEALGQILFYTGVTLYKMGCHASALESWNMADRLKRHRGSRIMLRRLTNDYGMPKDPLEGENEDFRAFRMIQTAKYLATRGQGRFGSPAERDMIRDLIDSAWEEVSRENPLDGLSFEEKKDLFADQVIIFPTMTVPLRWGCSSGVKVLPFEGENRRFLFKKNCPCGSGKPYGNCCGRVLVEDELHFGVF